MPRIAAVALGTAFFCIPLYPAFITLTAAPVPGISLLPRSVTLALLVLVALIAATCAALLFASPRWRLPTLLPVAAFPAAALAAAACGLDPLAGALFIAILVFGVIWHAAILRFFPEPHVAAAIFWSYAISGALASLVAIVMALTRTPAALYTLDHGRAVGTFVLPGELAGYLIVFVPIAFTLARSTPDPRLRVVAWTALSLASAAFVLAFSRAGWAGMAAAIAVYVLLRRRRNGPRYAVAIVGTAIVLLAFLFNAHHDPSENFTRLSIWQAALEVVRRFPLTGAGPFEFARIYPFVRLPDGEPTAFHAHSIVLTVAAETGLVGLAALAFGWWCFTRILRARLQAAAQSSGIPAAIAAGLAGTWVQGLIDTVSLVIFGLWLPMMALAVATAPAGDAPVPVRRAPLRTVLVAAALLAALPCAFVQSASLATYAPLASRASLAAHLPPQLGSRIYTAIARIAPLPFVEAELANDALRHGNAASARAYADRIPPGVVRSDLEARSALTAGRTGEAMRLFLEADDDDALQPFVARLEQRGRLRQAEALERRIYDRLAETGTRPNAQAEAAWRLGRMAARRGALGEAGEWYDRAIAIAPFNTKYLRDAGRLARRRGDTAEAQRFFTRAAEIDPTLFAGDRPRGGRMNGHAPL